MSGEKEAKEITFDVLADWLEKNRRGFYLGCRVEPHSPQINEFVAALHYYIEKDFGYITKQRKKQIFKAQQNNHSCDPQETEKR